MILFAIHLILASILFLCVNFIGKHSVTAGYMQLSLFVKIDDAPAFNFLYKSLTPVVFMVILSAVFKALGLIWINANIYLTVVYYYAIRLAFNILAGRRRLLNWTVQLMYLFVSIPLALYIYNNLIQKNDFLLPTKQELATAVWLSIIAFVYKAFNNIRFSDERTKKRKELYIRSQYDKYFRQYSKIIKKHTKDARVEALIFTIMIYEDFNRPKLYRIIENMAFYFGISKTLGIMQYSTDKMIDDDESVELGTKKIVDFYFQEAINMHDEIDHYSIRNKVIADYNKDDSYVAEINILFFIVSKLYYKETVSEYFTIDRQKLDDDYLCNLRIQFKK